MVTNPISQLALRRTELLLSCYPPSKGEEDEEGARIWIQAIALTLSQYSDQVICRVSDPLKGIPSTNSFKPSVAVVREECDRWQAIFDKSSPYIKGYEKRVAYQLLERKRWEETHPGAREQREFYESDRISDYILDCKGERPWENRSLTIGRFERS